VGFVQKLNSASTVGKFTVDFVLAGIMESATRMEGVCQTTQ
jgi:hypothetical protein